MKDYFESEFGEFLGSDKINEAKEEIGRKINLAIKDYIKNIELLTEFKIEFNHDNFQIKVAELAIELLQLSEKQLKMGLDFILRILFTSLIARVIGIDKFIDKNIQIFFESLLFHISLINTDF